MRRYIKPTLRTKYHIDFDWWQKKGQNLRRYLLEHACEECYALVKSDTEIATIDWIDPGTAEVFTVDGIWHVIHNACREEPEYLDPNLPVTSLIFRLFIVNNNTPLTPVEIHHQIKNKGAELILRILSGHRVYKGICHVAPPV